jgi:hypothetical protein
MNDALAEDFMKPLREAQTRLDQIKAETKDWEKRKAAAQSEYTVVQRAVDDLSARRIEEQKAYNETHAARVREQAELAQTRSELDGIRRQLGIPVKAA